MKLSAVLACAALLVASGAAAQPAPPKKPSTPETRNLRYGPNITLDQAEKVIAAAEAEAARTNQKPTALAVVDTSGALVMFKKFDGGQYTAGDYAIRKATVAARTRRPSSFDADRINSGDKTAQFAPDSFPFPGGFPIVFHDQVVGGIGESGLRENVTQTAANALR